jgi:hypothetical protein
VSSLIGSTFGHKNLSSISNDQYFSYIKAKQVISDEMMMFALY